MGSHGSVAAARRHARAGGQPGRATWRGRARDGLASVRRLVARYRRRVMATASATGPPRLVLVLSENWTMTPARDLRALVRIAQEAEDGGVDGVMLSEHIVLGASSGAAGRMENPRDYAAPGNQDPATPWPDSLTLLAGIATVTARL